ncbi:hypothetical protein [Neptuniibacter sp.]|uniref:hypothetical protein n=1 Tax=Neptuniibacter sp. TaxID=1962643 RepID=UPI002624EAD4|nr:hypothetical protein [Neptuniibacter sp.]MCP4597295.1 hypothetical protein [Neptuniibacter sp.]
MKQRINLYRPGKSRSALDFKSLTGSTVLAVGIVALFLIAGLALKFYSGHQDEKLAGLKAEKKRIETQVQALQAKHSSSKVSSDILAEQDRLKGEIASRKQLMSLLHHVEPEQSVSLSSYMYGLAEASQNDSWLTDFTIHTEKRAFSFHGVAITGPAVPLMFEAIGQTEVFQGMSISSLAVEALDSGVRFTANAKLRVND